MTTKAFSTRLPEALSKIIEGLTRRDEKSPSDFLREAAEEKVYGKNGYRAQFTPLIAAPQETMNRLRDKIEGLARGEPLEPLSRPELSALMTFWHEAYLRERGDANAAYVFTLLDLTKDLLEQARQQQIEVDFRYHHMKLDIASECEDYGQAFDEIKESFLKSRSINWAETLSRPVAALADKLDQYSSESIAQIFTVDRVNQLLPVAVTGSGMGMPDNAISGALAPFLPEPEQFDIGGITFLVNAETFHLMIQGGRHCYIFNAKRLMSLMMLAENPPALPEGRGPVLERSALEVHAVGEQVLLHQRDSYRLFLSRQEFKALLAKLQELLEDRRWRWLLQRFRNLRGDI